jgi:tRNA threonylcarbamoyladenosine biosynthesis protein TsaE
VVVVEPVIRTTSSADETFALGVRLGEVLLPRDFVGLAGQLGAGKTLFSRGVAQGAGVPLDDVSSPTYSIVQSYRGRLELNHADLYRLRTDDDLYAIGWFDLLAGDGAFLVEWIDQISTAAPADFLRVALGVVDADHRRFEISATGVSSRALLRRWLGA